MGSAKRMFWLPCSVDVCKDGCFSLSVSYLIGTRRALIDPRTVEILAEEKTKRPVIEPVSEWMYISYGRGGRALRSLFLFLSFLCVSSSLCPSCSSYSSSAPTITAASCGALKETAMLPEPVLMRTMAGSSGFLGSAGWGVMAIATLPEVVVRDNRSSRG